MMAYDLDNVASEVKIQEKEEEEENEEEFLLITTICTFTRALLPQTEDKFVSQPFYLHNTLECYFIEIIWEGFEFVAQMIPTLNEKVECNFNPYFGESTIFDQTSQCNYNFQSDKDNPTYTSCSMLGYCEFIDIRLLSFTFSVQHVRPYFENINPTQPELYERLHDIFKEKRFTDVKINVKGREFSVHKALIKRCSILYEIIRNNQNKKNRNFVEITDIEPDIFEVILKFLYLGETGTIDLYENNNEFLFNVILAADFYQINDLKHKLINIAIKYLSIQNAIHNLIFAEKFNIFILKENCMKYIRVYGKPISKTALFQELVDGYPKLSADMLLYVLRE
ncbi:PREDICTED: speckle-type POZ protein-like [Polistes canadensis]|uniref:speckle-type POZ protein-like n=1 Tax=Polistes canadensis TaxID=91411 RepID=UPI000718B56F|nr:PREDICTED: speckle-type POZ protein-like [Polistes canadensis]